MIQGNTWHEYSNELKRFLCDVAKSWWAWYLVYPLCVFPLLTVFFYPSGVKGVLYMFGINGQPFLHSGKGFFGQNGCSLSARATPKMTQSHT